MFSFSFTTALKKKILKDSKPKTNVMEKRWVRVLPFTLKLRWMNIWCKTQSRKEMGFMWALWNKAIVINTWRAKVDNSINQTWPLCDNEKESTLHNFWECCHAQRAWEYMNKALCVSLPMVTSHHTIGCPPTLETMCFCRQKSKASAMCGEHMVLAKRYHTLDFVN